MEGRLFPKADPAAVASTTGSTGRHGPQGLISSAMESALVGASGALSYDSWAPNRGDGLGLGQGLGVASGSPGPGAARQRGGRLR